MDHPSPLARATLLLLALTLLETLLRALLQPWPFPSLAAFGLDLIARAGRIAALLLLLLLAELTWRRLATGRAARARAWVERAFALLLEPRRTARLLAAFALATGLFIATAARRYDLRTEVGAIFATGLLAVAAAFDVGLALVRGRVAGPPGRSARAAWSVVLAALALLVYPRPQRLWPLVAAAVTALYVVAPTPRPRRGGCWARALGLLGALALGAGLVVDAGVPAGRRFASLLCPVSALGLDLVRYLTDLDRDGSSGALGLDCDDLDPARGPLLDDLPDDGVDQNCTGTDGAFARALARFAPGGPLAPRPPGARPARRPPIVLVTVDALRADALEPGGPGFSLPRTAAWARGCVRFDRARANASFTAASMFALHTGALPRHGLDGYQLVGAPGDERRGRLSVPPTIASALRLAGYATWALAPPYPLLGFLQSGFDDLRLLGASSAEARAPRLLAAARARLRATSPARPAFLWVHLLDAHAPYLTHGLSHAGYLAAARSIDAPLAAFLGELPADAVVALTADHGEAFGEHGVYTHGTTLYAEELHVPLVLCAPAAFGLGPPRRIPTLVGLVDLAPTLLDLAGALPPYPRHGESLAAHLRVGAPLRSPWVLSESWLAYRHVQALELGCAKWVRDLDGDWEALFDPCADPGERIDRRADHPAEAARMRALLGDVLDLELDAYRSWRLTPGAAARRPR